MKHIFSVIYTWKFSFVKYFDSSALFPLSFWVLFFFFKKKKKKHYTYTYLLSSQKFALALPDSSMFQINRVGTRQGTYGTHRFAWNLTFKLIQSLLWLQSLEPGCRSRNSAVLSSMLIEDSFCWQIKPWKINHKTHNLELEPERELPSIRVVIQPHI